MNNSDAKNPMEKNQMNKNNDEKSDEQIMMKNKCGFKQSANAKRCVGCGVHAKARMLWRGVKLKSVNSKGARSILLVEI